MSRSYTRNPRFDRSLGGERVNGVLHSRARRSAKADPGKRNHIAQSIREA